jgi:hypothetical protein
MCAAGMTRSLPVAAPTRSVGARTAARRTTAAAASSSVGAVRPARHAAQVVPPSSVAISTRGLVLLSRARIKESNAGSRVTVVAVKSSVARARGQTRVAGHFPGSVARSTTVLARRAPIPVPRPPRASSRGSSAVRLATGAATRCSHAGPARHQRRAEGAACRAGAVLEPMAVRGAFLSAARSRTSSAARREMVAATRSTVGPAHPPLRAAVAASSGGADALRSPAPTRASSVVPRMMDAANRSTAGRARLRRPAPVQAFLVGAEPGAEPGCGASSGWAPKDRVPVTGPHARGHSCRVGSVCRGAKLREMIRSRLRTLNGRLGGRSTAWAWRRAPRGPCDRANPA